MVLVANWLRPDALQCIVFGFVLIDFKLVGSVLCVSAGGKWEEGRPLDDGVGGYLSRGGTGRRRGRGEL